MPELTIAPTETTVDIDNDYLPMVDVSETPDAINKVTPASLLGTTLRQIRDLADPNADRIPFWDDSAGAIVWLTVGSGLSLSGTSLTATGGGSNLGDEITDATEFNTLITTAGSNPSITYFGIVTDSFPITTAYVVPVNMYLWFIKGAKITQGGGGSIAFNGVGLLEPLSEQPAFGDLAVTWASSNAYERPAAVSTELWDTGNTSLSDRLARANAAFGTKQVRIECHPRTITGTAGLDLAANTEVYFHPGDYPSTFSRSSGLNSMFGLDDNTYFHGPRSAVLNESTGTNGCRFIQPASAHTDIWTPKTNIIVEGLTFKGHPSATSDGSGASVLLGNCQNSAIRKCHFQGVHNYASILGGAGTTGKFAYNSEIVDNLYTKADTQAIAIINGKNCRIAGNWMDATESTNGGQFIDIEPNASYDAADDITIEYNVLFVRDAYASNTIGGIAVQAAGGVPHIKGCIVRGNTIWGLHPSGYVSSSFTSRLANGISMIGVIDGVCENNHVRYGFQGGYSFAQCRRMTIKNNEATGCLDVNGFAASIKMIVCADSQVSGNTLKEVSQFDSSCGIAERDFRFSAVSSGSVITLTPYGAYRLFSFHSGLNVFFNGTVYTITGPTASPAYIASATDIDTGTDTFTKTSHGFLDGDMLRYEVGGLLSDVKLTGLSHGQTVFVVNKTANTFQVAATSGGSAINIAAAGTGTQVFFPTGIMVDNGAAGQDLKMIVSVGTVTTKTFTNAEVNTGADTITITAHGYQTGCIVKLTSPGTLPTFATNPSTSPTLDGIAHWYVIRIDADTIKLATTLALAIATTGSDITAAGSGTTTVTPEVETRFSSNYYDDNFAPDGHNLEMTGTSQIVATQHDRYVRNIADAGATATTADGMIVYTSMSAARTVTLPDATTCRGKEILVKDASGDAGTHGILLDPVVAGQTVNGAANVTIDGDYGWILAKSDGSNWTAFLAGSGAGGSIAGSTGATDNRVIRADGTGGATVQSSGASIDDSGNVSGNTFIATGSATMGFQVFANYGIGVGAGSLLNQVPTSGFFEYRVNSVEVFRINTTGQIVPTAKTPSSASDTGTAGTICADANFVYVCTATDTWKRVAIATW